VIGAQLGCFDILDTDELWQIVSLSFCVSLTASFLATLAGISLAAVLVVYSFPGRRTLVVLTNAFLGLPPVVVGLVLYLLQRVLSRTGSSRPMGKPRSALYAINGEQLFHPLGRGAEITYSCSASASDQASALAPASARTRSSSCANSAAAPEKTTRPSSRT